MAKQFTFTTRIDTSAVKQDTQVIRQLIEAAFQPVQFRLPDFNTSQIDAIKNSFGQIDDVKLTKPLEELQLALAETEDEIKRLDSQLNETFIKGGLPRHTQEYNNLLADYQKQQKDNFGSSNNAIRFGDLRKEFVNDTAAAADIGRNQSTVKELEEKKRFTIEEQRKQLELEIQIESQRVQSIELQRAINQQEYSQLQQQIAMLSQAEQDSGGRELLDSAYQEYEATSKRLIEEERASVKTLTERKQRIAELEAKPAPTQTVTGERVTALTVTKASVENAEKLTAALKEAAEAQTRLAEATKQTSAVRNDTGLQLERQKLEMQRQNAVVTEELIQRERVAAEERKAAAQAGLAAQIEAAKQSTQAARGAANEQTEAARQATIEKIEIEKRATSEFIEEQKRKTAVFRQELKEQASEQRKLESKNNKSGSGGSLVGKVEGISNLLTGGLQAFATVQLVRGVANATAALDTLRVQSERSKVSLDILSGGADNASARIQAIRQAGNGTITTLQAVEIAVQATALGLANSTDQFGRLATAARAVTLVSPVIKDVNSAISEISLAGANQSFRRLDQLGLSVTEVKDKIAELQSADKSLSDQQAFSAAVIDTLNSKYGALLQTTQAQASGQERLTTAWEDFKVALADTAFVEAYDNALGDLAETLERLRALTSEDISFFGSLQGAQAELEKLSLGINEADSTWSKFKQAFGADLEAPAVASPFKKENLESAIQLFDQVKKLQDSGSLSASEYDKRLRNIVATVRLNTDTSKDYSAEIVELSKQIEIAAQLQTSSSAAGKTYATAINLLGESFINQSAEAQKLVTSLSDIQAEFDRTGDVKKYSDQLNQARLSFELLTRAAGEYNKAAEAKSRAEALGDAESNLVKAVEAEAAQLIASGEDYDKVVKELQAKKEMIRREIESIPADINPDDIPLIVARIKFEVDKTELDNFDTRSAQNIINDAIQQAQAELKAERTKERDDRADEAKNSLKSKVQDTILGLIKDGLDPAEAERIIKEYDNRISKGVNSIGDEIDPTTFKVKMTEFSNDVEGSLTTLVDSFNQSTLSPDLALDDITRALQDIGTSAASTTPGIAAARDELVQLYDEIASSGTVTKDQADRLRELGSVAFALGDSTGNYANEVADLGDSFFDANTEAGSLFDEIANLEGKYVDGKVPLDEYNGRMSALVDRLVELAKQAGLTGKELEDVVNLATELSAAGITGGSGYVTGRNAGTADADAIRVKAAEQTEKEKERAAEKAQREWERAGKAAEQAAQRASAAFESSLQKVPGLFGTSGVTQDQLDLAAAGVPQNFADDFVRRLEDVVVNKKQRSDVSIADAQQALVNVGVDAANLTGEQVLLLIKQKWNDGSLFSNPDNLKLINFEAVTKNLELQKKGEEGKQAIIDYVKSTYGMAIDDVIGGTGQGATAGALPPGVAAPGVAQIDAAQAQVSANATLNLQISEDAINVAATSAAQLFEKVFTEYDFSTLANAPVSALELSFTNDKMTNRVSNVGVRMADLLQSGFTTRTGEVEWIASVVNAIEAEVTNNVLSSLAS